MVLEKTLESSLENKENKPILKEVNPKYSLEGLLQKLKLQHSDHWMQTLDSLGKTLMLEEIEEEKGVAEDEIVRWHHQLNGREFEQTLRDSKGKGSLT